MGALNRQRNTVRTWALYQLPHGLSVSTALLLALGNYFASTVSTGTVRQALCRLNIGAQITSAGERGGADSTVQRKARSGTGTVARRETPCGNAAAEWTADQRQIKLVGGRGSR